jgi:hypothetical protein
MLPEEMKIPRGNRKKKKDPKMKGGYKPLAPMMFTTYQKKFGNDLMTAKKNRQDTKVIQQVASKSSSPGLNTPETSFRQKKTTLN